MKRGLTTLLATVAFLAGHLAARACLTTMSLPEQHEPASAHSCCQKHAPEEPKPPPTKACCCSDGANLVLSGESVPEVPPDAGVALDSLVLVPDPVSPEAHVRGREPPRALEVIPHYTLFASLLI